MRVLPKSSTCAATVCTSLTRALTTTSLRASSPFPDSSTASTFARPYRTSITAFGRRKGGFTSWGPSVNVRYDFDHTGLRLDTFYAPYFVIRGQGQTVIILKPYEEFRERLRPQDFCFLGYACVLFGAELREIRIITNMRAGPRFRPATSRKPPWPQATTGAMVRISLRRPTFRRLLLRHTTCRFSRGKTMRRPV